MRRRICGSRDYQPDLLSRPLTLLVQLRRADPPGSRVGAIFVLRAAMRSVATTHAAWSRFDSADCSCRRRCCPLAFKTMISA